MTKARTKQVLRQDSFLQHTVILIRSKKSQHSGTMGCHLVNPLMGRSATAISITNISKYTQFLDYHSVRQSKSSRRLRALQLALRITRMIGQVLARSKPTNKNRITPQDTSIQTGQDTNSFACERLSDINDPTPQKQAAGSLTE